MNNFTRRDDSDLLLHIATDIILLLMLSHPRYAHEMDEMFDAGDDFHCGGFGENGGRRLVEKN